MSLNDDWLNAMADAGLRDDLPPLVYGADYALVWDVAEHPVLGDWEGGDWLMQAKDAPGTEGTVLATFTVTSGTLSGGVNPIAIALPIAAQSGITEPAAPFVDHLYFTLLYAPSGSSFTPVRAGLLPVLAGVSAE